MWYSLSRRHHSTIEERRRPRHRTRPYLLTTRDLMQDAEYDFFISSPDGVHVGGSLRLKASGDVVLTFYREGIPETSVCPASLPSPDLVSLFLMRLTDARARSPRNSAKASTASIS